MNEVQELSWIAMPKINLPVLSIIAKNDRIVDNKKTLEFFRLLFSSNENRNRLTSLKSGHAVQFERPKKIATELADFIRKINYQEQI